MPPFDEPYQSHPDARSTSPDAYGKRHSIGARERDAAKRAAERQDTFERSPEGRSVEDTRKRIDALERALPDNRIKGAEGRFDVDGRGIAHVGGGGRKRYVEVLFLVNGAYQSELVPVK